MVASRTWTSAVHVLWKGYKKLPDGVDGSKMTTNQRLDMAIKMLDRVSRKVEAMEQFNRLQFQLVASQSSQLQKFIDKNYGANLDKQPIVV